MRTVLRDMVLRTLLCEGVAGKYFLGDTFSFTETVIRSDVGDSFEGPSEATQ